MIPHRRSILAYTGDAIPAIKQVSNFLAVLNVVSDWQITLEEIFQLLLIP